MEMVSQKIISKWKSFTYKVTFLKGKPFRGRKQLVSGVGNHFLDPYFSFTKVVVISLMGTEIILVNIMRDRARSWVNIRKVTFTKNVKFTGQVKTHFLSLFFQWTSCVIARDHGWTSRNCFFQQKRYVYRVSIEPVFHSFLSSKHRAWSPAITGEQKESFFSKN